MSDPTVIHVHEVVYNGGNGDGTDTPGDGDALDYEDDGPETEEEWLQLQTTDSGDGPRDPQGWSADKVNSMLHAAGYREPTAFRAGSIKGQSVVVETTSQVPIWQFQPPLSLEQSAAMTDFVADLLREGAIEPTTTSRYNAPCFLVKKGTQVDEQGRPLMRLVINFTALNKVCSKVIFEWETLESSLQRATQTPAGEQRWFAKLDLKSFFFQMAVDPESRDYFAFTAPDRKRYRFTCAPMGWCSSPSVCGQFMALVMAPFHDWSALLVDDAVVWAPTLELLEERFTMLLSSLHDHGLQLNFKKVLGGSPTITFGGYDISANKIAVSREKVECVRQWAVPDTKRSLRRFVFFARWLSPFLESFETRVSVLDAALERAKTTVTLRPDEVEAFNDLKAMLTSDAFLVPFDATLPLDVHTDASAVAGAAILSQVDHSGHRRTLAYVSYRFSDAEKHYDTREIECLTVVRAAKRHMAFFQQATRINVYTDHRALQFLLAKSKQSSDRMRRWATFLGTFRGLVFHYIPGALNHGADALSRRDLNYAVPRSTQSSTVTPADQPTSHARMLRVADRPNSRSREGRFRVDFIAEWIPDLVAQYEADSLFAGVLPLLRDGSLWNTAGSRPRSLAKHLHLDDDGVIVDTSVDGLARIALPFGSVRTRVVEELHASLAHPGATALASIVRDYFFIPDAKTFFEKVNKSCIECMQSKRATTAPALAETYGRPQARWHTVSLDLATGFIPEGGMDALLVAIDELTRRVILIPTTATATAADVVKLVKSHLVAKFGYPRVFRTDKGSNFTGEAFATFCADNNITTSVATTDHHVAVVERAIGTVRERLRTVTARDGSSWLDAVYLAEFAMNRLPSAALEGRCPFECDTGYIPFMPLAVASATASLPIEAAMANSSSALGELIDLYHDGKTKSAAVHDKGRVASKIKVGSMVFVPVGLMKLPIDQFGNSKYAKGHKRYSGPHRVVADALHGNWEVEKPPGTRVKTVFHASVLKVADDDIARAAQRGLQLSDMVWPDGTPRVRKITGQRTYFHQQQYLALYVGRPDSTGAWVFPKQIPDDLDKLDEFKATLQSTGRSPVQNTQGFHLSRPLLFSS